MLKLSTETPAIAVKLFEKFGVYFVHDQLLITIGDTCHCANKNIFIERGDLFAHEVIHKQQQEAIGVAEWWKKYLEDDAFRLEQELEAYRFQLEYLKEVIPDRNKRFPFVKNMCEHLSGKMYGGLLTYAQAWKLLK